jgi:beta-lactamase class A
MNRTLRVALVALAGTAAAAAAATCRTASGDESAPSPDLDRRVRQVAAAVSKEPAWPDDVFDDVFRANVPAATLRKLLSDTFAAEGAVTTVTRVRAASPRRARYEFACARGGVLQCDARLADDAGSSIRYLRTYGSVPGYPDLAAAATAFADLRGKVSFAVAALDGERRGTLVSTNSDGVLDVASAFKLYVLGALVEDVAAGRRRWTDTVVLDARLRSIPTGLLHRWPDGSPVTLHTLAALMIEQSDNTATDHLIAALGRERVESVQARMGHAHPERNVPLLTTGEMFRLKYADGGRHAAVFLAKDTAARRAYLTDVVDAIPTDRIDTPAERAPRFVGSIGWFASADDLCAAMDWLRRATESGPAAPARAILAIESGTSDPPDVLPYQGYKGGRLPGVASRTYLARSAAGATFAVSATWNDADEDVDEPRLKRMTTRVLQLLGR